MSDFGAAPASGARERGTGPASGGTPPPVLLAALGAALLIAVTLVALLTSAGDGGQDLRPEPLSGAEATTPPAQQRVELTVSVRGDGSGRVRIAPGVACRQSCDREFVTGRRLTVTADAANGSTFQRWGGACSGTTRCSFVMDRARSLSVTFKSEPAAAQCDEIVDPGCSALDEPARPAGDCQDGRDNDGDGLVDAAQDPDCEQGGEAGSTAPPATTPPGTATTPPPTTTTTNECADGRDNDGDGLVDAAQDPGCAADRTEAG